jgi:hypothetical protein
MGFAAWMGRAHAMVCLRAGYSVALDGDVLVVGGYNFSPTTSSTGFGAAWIFRRNSATGLFVEELRVQGTKTFDNCGRAVAVKGDVVALSCRKSRMSWVFALASLGSSCVWTAGWDPVGSATDSGVVRVYRSSGSAWKEEALLTHKDFTASGYDRLGYDPSSLVVDTNTIAVGAPYLDKGATTNSSA